MYSQLCPLLISSIINFYDIKFDSPLETLQSILSILIPTIVLCLLIMQIFALRNIHYGVLFELLWVTVEDDVVGLMLLFQVAHITSLDSL